MKKLSITLCTALLIAVTSNVQTFAKPLDKNKKETIKNLSQESIDKSNRKVDELKKEKDVKILFDGRKGFYTFTHSDDVESKNDLKNFINKYDNKENNRVKRSANSERFQGQNSTNVSISNFSGKLEQWFYEDLNINNSGWGNDDSLEVNNGRCTTNYTSSGSDTRYYNWQKIIQSTDNFVFKYKEKSGSSIGGSVTLGGSDSTSGGLGESASGTGSYNVSYTHGRATVSVSWPTYDSSDNYYSRGYSGIYCTAYNINGYSHSSYAMVQFSPGQPYQVQANASRSI